MWRLPAVRPPFLPPRTAKSGLHPVIPCTVGKEATCEMMMHDQCNGLALTYNISPPPATGIEQDILW